MDSNAHNEEDIRSKITGDSELSARMDAIQVELENGAVSASIDRASGYSSQELRKRFTDHPELAAVLSAAENASTRKD